LILSRTVAWTEPRKAGPLGYIIKTYTYSNTPAQQAIRSRFANAAAGTRGHTGKLQYRGRSMPRPAVEIARAMGGRVTAGAGGGAYY
jgi:hypothetical protein